jgi:putative ribosome biogenesis GTPase RsgA
MRVMSFVEKEDFYYDENGLMVLTAKYLRKRGHCCHSDCRHCPYNDEPTCNIPLELQLEQKTQADDDYLKYLELADQESKDEDKNNSKS